MKEVPKRPAAHTIVGDYDQITHFDDDGKKTAVFLRKRGSGKWELEQKQPRKWWQFWRSE